jgi:hypothetical protein
MSLKTIHIVFVIASLLVTAFFGVWAWREYFGPASTKADLLYGILSIAAFAGLLAYGKYFLKKLKHINYL